MNRLKIVEKDYKFHIIFVIDKVIRFPTGSKFIITEKVEGESKKEIKIETTLQNLKNDNK